MIDGRPGLDRLAPRERDVLRLLSRGHDAKSAAAALGLSVHTVNERLRDARRALGVTSSRAAARLLADSESGTEKPGDEPIGVDRPAVAAQASGAAPAASRETLALVGVLAMLVLLLAATLVLADGVEPVPAPRPRVVAMSPRPGASVPPGRLEVSVRYDRPMRGDGWSFVSSARGAYPDCASRPRVSADRRGFTLDCTVRSGARHALGFNGGRFMNFRAEDGTPAEPAETWFAVR